MALSQSFLLNHDDDDDDDAHTTCHRQRHEQTGREKKRGGVLDCWMEEPLDPLLPTNHEWHTIKHGACTLLSKLLLSSTLWFLGMPRLVLVQMEFTCFPPPRPWYMLWDFLLGSHPSFRPLPFSGATIDCRIIVPS